MLDKYHKLQPKPETIDELKVALQPMIRTVTRTHQQGCYELHQALHCLLSCQLMVAPSMCSNCPSPSLHPCLITSKSAL